MGLHIISHNTCKADNQNIKNFKFYNTEGTRFMLVYDECGGVIHA